MPKTATQHHDSKIKPRTYMVTQDCVHDFALEIEAEVQAESERQAQAHVAALINKAIESLEQHGIHLQIRLRAPGSSSSLVSNLATCHLDAWTD